jgi:hypothetical protein
MNADHSDVKRTIDLILADLTEEDLHTLDVALERGHATVKLDANGMKVSGFNEATISQVRTAISRATRAMDQDRNVPVAATKPIPRQSN